MAFELVSLDLDRDLRPQLEEIIKSRKVVLFLKGTPEAPSCSFSDRAAAAIIASDSDFSAVDVLQDIRIRQELVSLFKWPTIPQLFVGGEIVGGADIITRLAEENELESVLAGQSPVLIYEERLG